MKIEPRIGWVALMAAAFLLLPISDSTQAAEERVVESDEDKDGRKETRVFYDGDVPVKTVADKNNDGKPDLLIQFKAGVKSHAEEDSDLDGAMDRWYQYDSKGNVKRIAKDTNHDQKPDQYQEMLSGRNLVLKEYDRNFDGKIDKRSLMEWNANKKLPIMMGSRLTHIASPGYRTLKLEEDNDYDGTIDVHKDKSAEAGAKSRVGEPI